VGSSVIKLSSLKDLRISKGLVFILLAAFCAGAYFLSHKPSSCKGPWNSPEEMMECKFPNPPIGRWKAVYSEEFAKEYNLPPENISSDLSPGVDYMEMDVQPYAENGVACLVNMLIKKPNDVAVYNSGSEFTWSTDLNANRTLLRWIDLDSNKDRLKLISTFGLSSRNDTYDPKRSYSIGSTFAFYVSNVLNGYDYISANANCYHLISKDKLFPDGFAFNYAKGSIWGYDKPQYKSLNNPNRPTGESFFNSRIYINIPSELLLTVFEDMPVGGQ